MVLALYCTAIRCQHKFAIHVALVRQFSPVKTKNCLRALGVINLKND